MTSYRIPKLKGGRVKYDLQVIDTSGIAVGSTIKDQIKSFFERKDELGSDSIDVICFVIPGSTGRLAETDRSILSGIRQVFGGSITNNIAVMTTHADERTQPVLNALRNEGFIFKKDYRFNHSALYGKEQEHVWKMNMASFSAFFNDLPSFQSKSFLHTEELLN